MPKCDCLTSEQRTWDEPLPHYAQCATVYGSESMYDADTSAIRELAEIAASRDIDVALSVLGSWRAGNLNMPKRAR